MVVVVVVVVVGVAVVVVVVVVVVIVVVTIIQLGHVSSTGILEAELARDPPESLGSKREKIQKKLAKAIHGNHWPRWLIDHGGYVVYLVIHIYSIALYDVPLFTSTTTYLLIAHLLKYLFVYLQASTSHVSLHTGPEEAQRSKGEAPEDRLIGHGGRCCLIGHGAASGQGDRVREDTHGPDRGLRRGPER